MDNSEPQKTSKFIEMVPIISIIFLEYANIGQLFRMWHDHTAAGQEVTSWAAVGAALWLWLFYYRAKKLALPFYCTLVSIILNHAVIFTSIYFRYLV